jgi:hypothetical protein
VNRQFGIRVALAMMEDVVRASKGNPAIHAWALRVAGDHVAYPTPASKARALLTAIRSAVKYLGPDPCGESMRPFEPGALRMADMDADDEAVALAAACESLGLTVKLRLVQQNHACSVAVDVQQGDDWVTFAMGER